MTEPQHDILEPPITKPAERGRDAREATLPYLTLGIAARLLYFERMLGMVKDLPGDIVECGVGWGRSLLDLALLARIEERGRHVWGFDSFEGFPQPSPEDASPRNVQKGEWKTDLNSVLRMLHASGLDSEFVDFRITLMKGFFNESLPKYSGAGIALLHIDADIYQSYMDVLNNLYEKVLPGGVVMFDEFQSSTDLDKFPGARKAIVEFFGGTSSIKLDPVFGRYYSVKGAQ